MVVTGKLICVFSMLLAMTMGALAGGMWVRGEVYKAERDEARQELEELQWKSTEGVTWKWSDEPVYPVGRRIRIPIRAKS